MPDAKKCQACRKSKKACSRDGQLWDEQDPQTRCSRCKIRNFGCGPDEYKTENDQGEPEGTPGMGQRFGEADIREIQLVNMDIKVDLQRRLHELSDSESFHLTRQRICLGPYEIMSDFIVPEDLRHALKDIVRLADRAYASKDVSNAEVAYTRVVDWYMALGPEVKQPRQDLLLKVGNFYEDIGHNDEAAQCYSKIFEDLPQEDPDINVPFHHAIRKCNTKDQLSKDALMGIIRCCPLCRFKLRNGERQTPLSLAVFTAKEEVAVAILVRLRDPQVQFRIDQLYLDARDCRMQTILTTAVLSGCSLTLINALIKYGSNVNPEVWKGGALSPLQAASYPGHERIEVAFLLIRHQADPDHVFPNSSVAELIINNRLPAPVDIPLPQKLVLRPDA